MKLSKARCLAARKDVLNMGGPWALLRTLAWRASRAEVESRQGHSATYLRNDLHISYDFFVAALADGENSVTSSADNSSSIAAGIPVRLYGIDICPDDALSGLQTRRVVLTRNSWA